MRFALLWAVGSCDGHLIGRRGSRGPVPLSVLGLLVALTWIVGCARPVAVYGLRPEYPEAYEKFVKVESLQPTLRWEPFPRPQDRESDKEGWLKRIGNVTYDLKIWRADEENPVEYPGQLVYLRRGLPEPSHKIESSLKPSTKYFWTVRARFEIEGEPRVTEWGVMVLALFDPYWSGAPTASRLSLVPNPRHYRFKTPAE